MDIIMQFVLERLKQKREELTNLQEQFMIMCDNELQSKSFERNAINDLIVMQQLKSEISELERLELQSKIK